MIRNLAELLHELIESELPVLDASVVTHGPTVGDMYEGLTGVLLERAIPAGVDLRVVTGFASDGKRRSGQLDRMLVKGEGTRIPMTEAFIWHVDDIIAVVESKKTLRRRELGEAVEQLMTVKTLEQDWIRTRPDTVLSIRLANLAFAQMTGKVAPSLHPLGSFSPQDGLIFRSLVEENDAIIRVVLGHHGYLTEAGLRTGFLQFLETKTGVRGFGPLGLPQLIISGRFSLVKATGQPYTPRFVDGAWPVFFSTSANPMLILLELIWTRLQRVFNLDDPWGMDLDEEFGHPLLLGTVLTSEEGGEAIGWQFTSVGVSEKRLRETRQSEFWSPEFISEAEYVVLCLLLAGDRVSVSEAWFDDLARKHGTTADDLARRLINTRLVAARSADLELITNSLCCAILPDGRFVAAENNTGRLSRWIARQDEEDKGPTPT